MQLGGCSSWFCVDSNQGRVKTGEWVFLDFVLADFYLLVWELYICLSNCTYVSKTHLSSIYVILVGGKFFHSGYF